MKALKQRLQAYMARIDAMTLRERVFLFLATIVSSLAVADAMWLTPAVDANKKLVQQFASQTTELVRLREELTLVVQPVDPSKAVLADIAAAKAQMGALNEEINVLLPPAKSGPDLEQVLVQFLRRQEGLTLLGLRTLQIETAPVAGAKVNAAALPAGLTKMGLELRVSGPYASLVRYVVELEAALPALRWGAMGIQSESQPPELTLQVFLLGVQHL